MITRSFTVWTILRGCECVCSCMNPIGRQLASGLSFELAAIRCLRNSAAHGVNGNPSLMFCPTLKKAASGGSVGARLGTIGPPRRPLVPPRLSQVPDKSIFPLGNRGGGAFRSGLPSEVRGVSCRTKEGHCANNTAPKTHAHAAVVTALSPEPSAL